MDSGGSSSSGSRLSRIGQEAARHRRGDESQGDESRNDGISEVLTVVRSLQQQVSALQAQRSVTPTVNTNLDSSTGSASGKNKRLPKTLVVSSHVLKLVGEQFLFAYYYLTQSAVHQTVKHLKDISEDPLEWNINAGLVC